VNAWVVIPVAILVAAVLAERGSLVAMLIARRTGFLDRPAGYKAHGAPTPYLGGTAVLVACLVAAISLDGLPGRFAALLGCAALMWLVGTVDDRVNMPPRWRVIAELAAGAILWADHLGFTAFASSVLNLGFSMLWIVAIVNAFNLMDNIDGACGALAAVSTAGLGVAALVRGDTSLAVICFGAAAAGVGFLRHNLSSPARIFLGDGGSMPLGFLVAGLAMAVTRQRGHGAGELFVCGLFAGLPVLDTSLVMISRRRRGARLLTGGRDHLTHRARTRLGTPRRVVLVLAPVQAATVALAVLGLQAGELTAVVLGGVAIVVGLLAIVVLESPSWAPTAVSAAGPETANTAIRPLSSAPLIAVTTPPPSERGRSGPEASQGRPAVRDCQ
jgi:UDP-GlcNAc:undecaprenyl-phosphate GlcNAc-1-phosphate transferase